MLTWFIIHMAALVGDLAVFLVLLHTVGLSPPSLLLVSVTGAWTPGIGAHGLGAGISSHGSATSSGSPWTSQVPNLYYDRNLTASLMQIRTNWHENNTIDKRKAGKFLSKQGQPQPHFHSKARHLSTQL